jgi:hypothetical protein
MLCELRATDKETACWTRAPSEAGGKLILPDRLLQYDESGAALGFRWAWTLVD